MGFDYTNLARHDCRIEYLDVNSNALTGPFPVELAILPLSKCILVASKVWQFFYGTF